MFFSSIVLTPYYTGSQNSKCGTARGNDKATGRQRVLFQLGSVAEELVEAGEGGKQVASPTLLEEKS